MAIFKCEKCGATKEGRCKPKKCPKCSETGCMVKDESQSSGCGCACKSKK
jgi:rubrerythrin